MKANAQIEKTMLLEAKLTAALSNPYCCPEVVKALLKEVELTLADNSAITNPKNAKVLILGRK